MKYANYKTDNKFRIIWSQCTNISGMSPKKFRKISNPELEIFLCIILVRKYANKKTDRHTRNPESFEASIPTSQDYLPKKSEIYLIQNLISLYLSNFSKEVSQLQHEHCLLRVIKVPTNGQTNIGKIAKFWLKYRFPNIYYIG